MYDTIPLKYAKSIINKFIAEWVAWKEDFPFLDKKLGQLLGPFFVKHEFLFSSLEFKSINDDEKGNETYDEDASVEVAIRLIEGIKHFDMRQCWKLYKENIDDDTKLQSLTPKPDEVQDNYGWLIEELIGSPDDEELGIPFFMSMQDFRNQMEEVDIDLVAAVKRMENLDTLKPEEPDPQKGEKSVRDQFVEEVQEWLVDSGAMASNDQDSIIEAMELINTYSNQDQTKLSKNVFRLLHSKQSAVSGDPKNRNKVERFIAHFKDNQFQGLVDKPNNFLENVDLNNFTKNAKDTKDFVDLFKD